MTSVDVTETLIEIPIQHGMHRLDAPVVFEHLFCAACSMFKIVLLMIKFVGRFKPQPYIVQQGRLIFLRREVAARTALPTRYSENARCVFSASAVIVPPAMSNAASICATVLISFVRFCFVVFLHPCTIRCRTTGCPTLR